MEKLPDELIIDILSKLSHNEIMNSIRTSKYFKQVYDTSKEVIYLRKIRSEFPCVKTNEDMYNILYHSQKEYDNFCEEKAIATGSCEEIIKQLKSINLMRRANPNDKVNVLINLFKRIDDCYDTLIKSYPGLSDSLEKVLDKLDSDIYMSQIATYDTKNKWNRFYNKMSERLHSKKTKIQTGGFSHFKGDNMDYVIKTRLGSGAYGTTFIAEKDNVVYAIKQLELGVDKYLAMKEVDVLKKLAKAGCHQNVLCYQDSFEDIPDRCGKGNIMVNIVTDYFEGFTLDDFYYENLVDRETNDIIMTLDPVNLYKIISQLAEGLKFIHLNGVAHGDIKPQNILINNKMELKIIDFGSACATVNEMETCVVQGTVEYAAPEILIGLNKFVAKLKFIQSADIFSMGLVFFLLANLVTPYDAIYEISQQWMLDNPLKKGMILSAGYSQVRLEALYYYDYIRYISKYDSENANFNNLVNDLINKMVIVNDQDAIKYLKIHFNGYDKIGNVLKSTILTIPNDIDVDPKDPETKIQPFKSFDLSKLDKPIPTRTRIKLPEIISTMNKINKTLSIKEPESVSDITKTQSTLIV